MLLLPPDFEKPFDSPAILVVGHQTDGKSALVEALMGECAAPSGKGACSISP